MRRAPSSYGSARCALTPAIPLRFAAWRDSIRRSRQRAQCSLLMACPPRSSARWLIPCAPCAATACAPKPTRWRSRAAGQRRRRNIARRRRCRRMTSGSAIDWLVRCATAARRSRRMPLWRRYSSSVPRMRARSMLRRFISPARMTTRRHWRRCTVCRRRSGTAICASWLNAWCRISCSRVRRRYARQGRKERPSRCCVSSPPPAAAI